MRKASRECSEPITRSPWNPNSISSARRAMNALRMVSPRAGRSVMIRRMVGRRDMQHLRVASGDRTDHGAPAAQNINVAGEFPWLMHGHRLGLVAGTVDDLHRARKHDKEPAPLRPGLEQRLTIPQVPHRSDRLQGRDLGVVEPGKAIRR